MTQSVELLGTYGGDETHALAAWTSTHRELAGKFDRIPGLLKALAVPSENPDEEHGTPFEKSYIEFLVRVDTATHIQTLKHRIAVSVNGESARYKELQDPTCHIPDDWPEYLQQRLDMVFHGLVDEYKVAVSDLEPLLGRKRAKESARFFLPYANQLSLNVSFNFRSFIHFQKLRNHTTAQKEIHDVAEEMLRLVRETGDFKHSLEAFGLGE